MSIKRITTKRVKIFVRTPYDRLEKKYSHMKKLIGLLAAFLLVSTYAIAQTAEICNNGIDDDLDGFIDCFDSDCVNFSDCKGLYVGNDANCEAKPSAFPKFSMTLDWGSPNQVTDHLSRITIGDLDRDFIPEIVTLNSVTNAIYILDGKTGAIKKSITPGYDVQREVAIANLKKDNCAEIFTYGIISGSHYIISYDCNLVELWRTQIRGNVSIDRGDPVHFGLADFNGDGNVELYCKDMILNAFTGAILVNSTSDWRYVNGGPVAVDIDATSAGLELVLGLKIYGVNLSAGTLTLLNSHPDYKTRTTPTLLYRHTTSVADYNLDGKLDVIATGSYKNTDNTSAFLWDPSNSNNSTNLTVYNDYNSASFTIAGCNGSTGQYYKKGWEQGMGRINIADLDGDGKMNASFVSGKYLYALKEDFTLLWRKDVKEETSGITGCTLFDFNGDGKSEVVYRDENYLYIINGVDGSTFTQQTCISRTQLEYPIVADVDNDGATELCVTCGFDDILAAQNFCNNTYYENGQVRAYRSAAEPWVPARKLWNQHGYFNVNVNDDLTIPLVQQNTDAIFSSGICTPANNRPLNTFLNQAPFLNSKGCPIYAAPDLEAVTNSLVINPPTCPDQNFTVSFQIQNLGDAAVTGNLPITFYNGDPTLPGAVKLNTVNLALSNFTKADGPKSTGNLTVTGPAVTSPTGFTLYVFINDAGTSVPPVVLPNSNILECKYDAPIFKQVTSLPFHLTAEKIDNTKCIGSTTPDNGAGSAYQNVNGSKVTAPFTFSWFNTAKPVSGAANYTGAVYSGLAAGTYSVYATSTAYHCNSDTVSVNVGLITNTGPTADISLVNPYTNCQNPNGKLRAVVNNNPADTINFTFAWYEGPNFLTDPLISVSATASHLKNKTYSLLVTSKITGCPTVKSADIPDNTTSFVVNTNTTNALCSSSNSGSASADVGGNTTNYTFKWYNGSTIKPVPDFTGATYTNLSTGSYTVVATDNVFLCSSSPPKTITVTQTPAITATATKLTDQTSCDLTSPTGSAKADVSGATTGYTFKWYIGQDTLPANKIATSSTATGLAQGIYTVKAQDITTGCSDTDEVTINTAVVTPTLSATKVDVTHCLPYDGKITASVSTGVPTDYTFSWYNGSSVKASPDYPDTDNVLDNIFAGTYTVSAISTINKCQAAAITVTILDKTPVISMSLVNTLTVFPSDCTTPTGKLGVQVSEPGNTLGYNVQWYSGLPPFTSAFLFSETISSSPGQTVFANIPTGLYSVVAMDRGSGCSATQSFDLPFANSHKLTYVSQNDVLNCVPGNNGNVTVHLTPSTPATTFNESDYVINVYQGSNPTGAPIQVINGVAGQGNYTTSVAMAPGAYSFQAVCTGPAGNNLIGCKSVPFAATILQSTTNPTIASSAQNSNTNCTGAIASNGLVTVSIDGGATPMNYNIKWFEGSTTSSPALGTTTGTTSGVNGETAQNLKGGTYTVQVTNTTGTSTGCLSTASFLVLDNTPTISLASADLTITPQTLCSASNGSAKVNSISENGTSVGLVNYTFNWFDSNLNPLVGNTNMQSPLAAGMYFVQAKNITNNCVTASPVQFTIDNQTIGTVSVALTNFVQPTRCLQPTNVLGSLEATASGTSATGYSYNWYLGTSASGAVQAITQTIGGITVISPATEAVYTVEVINNSNQCKAIDTYHLPLIVTPVTMSASAAPLTNCAPLNGSVFATVTSGSPNNYTYTWYTGAVVGGLPSYSTKLVNGLDLGPYTVTAVDNADAFCQTTASVTVEDSRVYTAPIAVQISPLTNCFVFPGNGVAAASVVANGVKDSINYVFQWYLGTNTSGAPIYVGSEITGLTNTLYTVVATDRITSCPSQSTVTITSDTTGVLSPQTETISDVTSCVTDNGAISASVNGNTKDYIFDWYKGTAVTSSPDYVGAIYFPPAPSNGSYLVTAQSRITGCVSNPVPGIIGKNTTPPQFKIQTAASGCNIKDQNGNASGNGVAEVIMLNNVTIESITWSVGSPPVTGPVIDSLSAGKYSVKVVTTLGCSDTASFIIKSDVRPYNGISRNNDNLNEIFQIGCIDLFPNNTVQIFNRAGTLVYENRHYDNTTIFFDGHSNRGVSPMGNWLPDGTYFYLIDRGDGGKPMAGYLEIVK
jgi:hypothetical protein